MADAVIDNPILNSPFEEPTRHWRFSDEGITDQVEEVRRTSAYFMPIAKAKASAQLQIESDWTADRLEENRFINQVRERVSLWRKGNYPGITLTTRRLLDYWQREDREKRLFFAQLEAVETAVYLTEVINKKSHEDVWIVNELRRQSDDANPGLYRIAHKMATGSGKTVVMAMLIAWQALNKLANRQDVRFTDAFLIVAPGITIRDRLRVLLPHSPDNYYRERDLLPNEDLVRLGETRIIITNFHTFLLRDRQKKVSKTTKALLTKGEGNPFQERPEEMVRRVLRELGSRKNIVVLNDEAHHCYQHRIGGEETDFFPGAALTADEKKEAKARAEEARVWVSGLQAVNDKVGIKAVFDLSATPFFLSGSGYPEGTLFPWVVSDFALIDAIESGLVKIPRVPVADDSGAKEGPIYRNLWVHIREDLPKKNVKAQTLTGPPNLPAELEGALHSLYGNYAKSFEAWRKQEAKLQTGSTPPVFIVVCNNTSVSKMVFDFLAGYERVLDGDRTMLAPGALELFSNVVDGQWQPRPNTILVDSAQLESGDALSADFKKAAAVEIERFRAEFVERFPGRDPNDLTDADLMREVMNTVGKAGRLGEHVRCVVSVSMLTEGWDANTVTHILGVRAFSTQLLCEQVVGRGLRRRSYTLNEQTNQFDPEYAEVYGVPFSFIPTSGSVTEPAPPKPTTRVRALEERAELAISFPRVRGYRYELGADRLAAKFTDKSTMTLSTQNVPSETELLPVVGAGEKHRLDDLRNRRDQEVAFRIAKRVFERNWPDQPWAFPQLVRITREWMDSCLQLKDHTFPQLLLLAELAEKASERISQAVIRADSGEERLIAILAPYQRDGSTSDVDFDTTKPAMKTDPERCHVSHVVCDTGTWEQHVASTLEGMSEVLTYVKNEGLGFFIPYTYDGEQRGYVPDFIARVDDGRGPDDPLNLIIEVSGPQLELKTVKTETAETLWVPAVNNLGEFGRWGFVEVTDPWTTEQVVRAHVQSTVRLTV